MSYNTAEPNGLSTKLLLPLDIATSQEVQKSFYFGEKGEF